MAYIRIDPIACEHPQFPSLNWCEQRGKLCLWSSSLWNLYSWNIFENSGCDYELSEIVQCSSSLGVWKHPSFGVISSMAGGIEFLSGCEVIVSLTQTWAQNLAYRKTSTAWLRKFNPLKWPNLSHVKSLPFIFAFLLQWRILQIWDSLQCPSHLETDDGSRHIKWPIVLTVPC